MRRIGQMVVDIATEIASAEKRPKYERAGRPPAARGGERPYFGSIPDLGFDETGYKLSGVAPGGPAENGGIQAGDIIIEFGGKKIGNLDDFDLALRKYKAGDQVPTVVLRGGEKKTLNVTLDPPR
jgi:S1-C subfamily serine protease